MRGKATRPDILGEDQRGLVIPVGDLQYGQPEFPEDRLVQFLEWGVLRNAYFVGMGDWLEFARYTDRQRIAPLSDSTKALLDDMVRDKAQELVDKLAFTKGRWIGFIEGNHRWDFDDGRSVEQLFARELGGDFLGTMAFIRLVAEDRPPGAYEADTIVCIHHGYGGARTPGPRLINVERLAEGFEADIYLMAHDHSDVHESIDRMYCSAAGQLSYAKRKVFARTGGWARDFIGKGPQPPDAPAVDSRGGFAEERAFTPKAIGAPFFVIGYKSIDGQGYKPRIGYGRF